MSKLWARKKIASLMDSIVEGADRAEVRRQVIDVALAHHLVSKYTSLVAVDVTPTSPTGSPMTRAVPTELPAGWTYEGWTVIDGTPVTTGTFLAVDQSDNAAPFSGTVRTPNFPVPI